MTGNVFFLGYNLTFEVFPFILTAIIQKLGRRGGGGGVSPQIHTTGICMVKRLYLQAPNVLSLGTVLFYQFLTEYSLNNNTLDLIQQLEYTSFHH